MIQRWLGLFLELICMALALVVTGLAVKLRGGVSPGFTGVSLLTIIQFNTILQMIVVWCKHGSLGIRKIGFGLMLRRDPGGNKHWSCFEG